MRITLPFLLLFLAATISAQKTFIGKVVAVHDGDTFTMVGPKNDRLKIRLAGVDAPERKQDFGEQAMEYLAKLILDKQVTAISKRKDAFRQRLSKVTVNGRDVGLELIVAGLAWHYATTAEVLSEDEQQLYTSAEINARRAHLNLWTDPKPTVPWEFRVKEPVNAAVEGKVLGNRNSRVFHRPGCPGYRRVSPTNRVYFDSESDAEAAGFRLADSCKNFKEN